MFQFNYIIIEEAKVALLEEDEFEILGQIELVFNNRTEYGIMEEIPMLNEYLFPWFITFNELSLYLHNNNFAAFYKHESPGIWVLFNTDKDYLDIKEVKSDEYPEGIKRTTINEIVYNEIKWENERVLRSEFIDEINKKTAQFLSTVKEMNNNIIFYNYYSALERLHNELKML